MRYRYLHYDVFTAERFGGNQLAVLPHAAGLSTEQMQAITREFNFSESTFVLPNEREDTDIRMRIFTPGQEMPMAGHPTVGSTFALCHEGVIPAGQKRWVFGLNIGPTPVDIEWEGEGASFVWMNQNLPRFGPQIDDIGIADSVGLDHDDISATGLPVEQVSCGVPFVFIPVATRYAVDRAKPNLEVFRSVCQDAGADDHAMFVFSAERAGDR
ncbi:MAG: PhzF family phenazine biosynthesis protein, partial [Acidobacteria bacterium]